MKGMKVLNFGSLNYDYVYTVDHMVREGETLSSEKMETFLGGKGFNQSVALSRAGIDVKHAGAVGEEGEGFLAFCRENGIDTSYIRTLPGKSGHTIIQIDRNAQNCILLYGGANQSIPEEYVDEVLEDFGEGDFVLLQNEINVTVSVVEKAYAKKMKVVLNPSPFDSSLEACDMSKVSVFLMNEIEGYMMTGEKEPEKILDVMEERYPDACTVLTLGSDGVVCLSEHKRYRQEIVKVKAVDTTAAGDTFTGYFIAGLADNLDIPVILKRCVQASAIAVSRKGAAPSIPSKEEVEEASIVPP